MKFVLALSRPLLFLVIVAVAAAPVLATDNTLGLYYDTSASIAEIDISANSIQSLYLILLNPVNEDYDGGGIRDVGYIGAFECAVEPPGGDVLLGVSFPVFTVNVGSTDNIVAGYGTPISVSSERSAVLATFNVMTMGNNPVGYRLLPTVISTHDNTMAYLDAEDPDDEVVDMVPVSGSHDLPVFTFGDYTIEEDARWGGVKALYRQ